MLSRPKLVNERENKSVRYIFATVLSIDCHLLGHADALLL